MRPKKAKSEKRDAPIESKPESEGKLMLVAVKPREPSPAEQIENCLGNPFSSIQNSMAVWFAGVGPREGSAAFPDKTLLNLKRLLDGAWSKLDELAAKPVKPGADRISLESIVQAKEAIKNVHEWLLLQLINRSTVESGAPEQPLTVPTSTLEQLKSLALAGRRLALVWSEPEARPLRRSNAPTAASVRSTYEWVRALPQDGEVKATELAKRLNKSRQYLQNHELKGKARAGDDSKLVVVRRSSNRANAACWYSRASVLSWMERVLDA